MPPRRLSESEEATEINLSPMIDCIFILLIFFIVTTVFVEETGLQVNKPDAAAEDGIRCVRSRVTWHCRSLPLRYSQRSCCALP